ncbi:hypothetical protein Taro_013495 [Colocasia esculenta]|uniref:Uncharacterized protein n=1 Tax=Colocasia esculenta TaxID=4460 RepID=A0A843UC62_COLES|nr:hypothetical protein [Colocasia esculenta]
MTMLGNIIRARSGPWEEHLKGYNSQGSNDLACLILRFKSYWALSLTLRYLSLCSQVRPRMNHTLKKTGTTWSDVLSTLASYCYI